jgi:hypothetical protein
VSAFPVRRDPLGEAVRGEVVLEGREEIDGSRRPPGLLALEVAAGDRVLGCRPV